ncbi:hypothetical protein C7N43_24025 [Sphingobacteriales bacterium UPWRP_1]|nr:hypothetical protein BVG80_12785 [Sphingobacteriales bacterium TSM_CSM]PSJ74423.1 hypothetical protein C7N43_24025 [Sphingobacteriales bacterium UPWRP_1]
MKRKFAGWAGLLCTIACLCWVAACDEEGNLNCPQITIGKYDATNTGDPYFITQAGMLVNCLYLKVSYSGGCLPHDSLALRWNGALAESFPPQAYLSLWHSNLGDLCEAIEDTAILFDLSDMNPGGTYETIIVHLAGYEQPLYYHKP